MGIWENKALLERINDRLSQQKIKYERWRPAQDQIIHIFRPDMSSNIDDDGDFFGSNIFEGTPPYAVDTMATAFQGNTVSKSIDWIMYTMGDYKLKGIDELDNWCQNIRDHMTAVYRQSNFYDVQPQFTKNAFSVGSPVMFGEEDILKGKIYWMPTYYRNTYVFYNKYNEPEGVIIEDTEWTVKQVIDRFIPEKGEAGKAKIKEKLSINLNKLITDGQYNEKVTILKVVFKATDPIWEGNNFKKPKGNYKWLTVYFESGTDKDKNTPLNKNMGDFSQPFTVWDYDKKQNESSSRTPAFSAIWDALSLQQVHKNYLENVQNQNRPPIMALNDMRNRLNLGSEGITYVEKDEYQTPPKPLDLIGSLEMNGELSLLLSQACERWFHLDEFRTFNNLTKTNKQPVSALQILKMAAENSVLLSPALESQGRALRFIDDRMMSIEMRAGRGPFSPQDMANITDIITSTTNTKSVVVAPEFISQLGRAQKVQQSLDPIITGVDIAADISAKIDPDLAMLSMRGYGALNDALDAIGFPMKNFKPEDDYNEAKDALNQQRAEAQQKLDSIEMMKASKNLQGPVDPNSILAGAGKAI